MLLNSEQKTVFARWLENQIYTAGGILEQMQKINTPEAILKKYRAEQIACQVVLRMITSGESMTIGS